MKKSSQHDFLKIPPCASVRNYGTIRAVSASGDYKETAAASTSFRYSEGTERAAKLLQQRVIEPMSALRERRK